MTGIIESIRLYPGKGEAGRELVEARLIENLGLEGDFHAKGGERQLSLILAETRDELMAQEERGLCFSRFKENITIRGPEPKELRPGSRFKAGEALLEISGENKRCHQECSLYEAGRQCPLAGKSLFARVLKSGIIRTGDRITQLIERQVLEKDFTHFDSQGNAIMVDVGDKEISSRTALARGCISMNHEAMNAVLGETAKKGDVLGVARIAGIMAAKRCAELIPLCHPLNFDKCSIDFSIDEKKNEIEASCTVKLSGKTGAEMEALTGVSLALLTIYDMCKALDKAMLIGNIRLCEKTGGKSGNYLAVNNLAMNNEFNLQ